VVVAVAIVASLAALCGAIDLWLAPLGLVAGTGFELVVLRSAVERRRRRLAGELVPLLELFTLELSAGGTAMSALGSVSLQVDGELAGEFRGMLIASQIKGSPSFEARLLGYAERIRIPALATLATTLGADRDFGTGASQGVRALAMDLRRAQRRDLITHSRKALNHVLLPAALGVLLPFLGVLMYPAVSVLQRSLR
jgi:Flp pilus assembly protein TadB